MNYPTQNSPLSVNRSLSGAAFDHARSLQASDDFAHARLVEHELQLKSIRKNTPFGVSPTAFLSVTISLAFVLFTVQMWVLAPQLNALDQKITSARIELANAQATLLANQAHLNKLQDAQYQENLASLQASATKLETSKKAAKPRSNKPRKAAQKRPTTPDLDFGQGGDPILGVD